MVKNQLDPIVQQDIETGLTDIKSCAVTSLLMKDLATNTVEQKDSRDNDPAVVAAAIATLND